MRPNPLSFFRQSLKSDSFLADEIINIYLLRPIASVIVWILYPTSITPNMLTVAAIVAGFAAAGYYWCGTAGASVAAGLLITIKDVLDDADGQLARAKDLYSRRGRFLDSIGDFAVNVAVFFAISYSVFQIYRDPVAFLLGFISLAGITLRVSYHVFYQASFLHRQNRYKLNRIIEEITEEDRAGDRVALMLQQVFLLIYGWQDRLIMQIDCWCKGRTYNDGEDEQWYGDRLGLRLSGLMGFGTELALLTICSLFNQLLLYLWLNVVMMNGIWVVSTVYRKFFLKV